MSGGVHDGHRERMKKRYLEQGLEGFSDDEALELLLYYAIGRLDVNPLAHRLLDRFGSFRAVLDADPAELEEVEGVGGNTALLLHLVKDLNRRYLLDIQAARRKPKLDTAEASGRFFLPYFYGLKEERIYAALLDDKLQLISCRQVAEGSISAAQVSVRKLVELAIREKATGILLAHNHPAGQAVPSLEDREATLRIHAALAAVQIRLLDHIIVAGEDYISMQDCGYFRG